MFHVFTEAAFLFCKQSAQSAEGFPVSWPLPGGITIFLPGCKRANVYAFGNNCILGIGYLLRFC